MWLCAKEAGGTPGGTGGVLTMVSISFQRRTFTGRERGHGCSRTCLSTGIIVSCETLIISRICVVLSSSQAIFSGYLHSVPLEIGQELTSWDTLGN